MANLTPNKKHKALPRRDNMVDLNSMVDDYLDEAQSPVSSPPTENFKLDVREKDDEYIVDAEFAGYDKEDIQMNFNYNVLAISAEKDDEMYDEDEKYIHRERSSSLVERQIYFPNVAEGEIIASFENGILQVHIPKAKELETEKIIEIK